MKYFTKKWYELMQKCHCSSGFERIADKTYSDEDIASIYNQKLNEYCQNLIALISVEKLVEKFNALYKQRLVIQPYCPHWLINEVDRRLIALRTLPASAYDRLKKEEDEYTAEFNRMSETAQNALAVEKTKIPEELSNGFSFHDGLVVSLKNVGDDIILTVQIDSLQVCDGLEYAKITFEKGNIIQMDDNLKIGSRQLGERNNAESYICWLHEELYKTENGYEAHMLLLQKSLVYLTVQCRDIKIEYAENFE